jgi:SRSO17 transposase
VVSKPEIALAQVREALAAGGPAGIVLADAAYGDKTGFRDRLTALGMRCAVRIRSSTTVWPPVVSPLPAKHHATSSAWLPFDAQPWPLSMLCIIGRLPQLVAQ